MRVFAVSATTLLLVSIAAAQTPVSRAPRVEAYESAAIDANGNLAIMTTGGQTVSVRKEGEQTSFSAPVVSPSKAAVGAQAMFSNCCTTFRSPADWFPTRSR